MGVTNVVAAILIQHDEVLICKRGPGGPCAHLWEFPGGKIEPGETPQQALQRELQEELSLPVQVVSLFDHAEHSYGEKAFSISFYRCEAAMGAIRSSVHDEIKWERGENLKNYTFCPADEHVVSRIASELL